MLVANKPVATLAAAMTLLFLLIAGYESNFFLLHFFEAVIYLVMILLFFYLEDRYAYILGVFVPPVWIVLSFATGMVHISFRELGRALTFRGVSNPAGLVTSIIIVLGVLLMLLCWRALRREIGGTGYWRSTVFTGLAITIAYYGVLIYWFYRTVQP